MTKRVLYLLTVWFCFAMPLSAQSAKTEGESVPFKPERWTITDSDHKIGNYAGRESLFLDGEALVKNVELQDGIIEVDIAPNFRPSFAGICFRAQSAEDFDLVYLRTHKSKIADAVQYTPHLNGLAAWQLYYANNEYQSRAEFKEADWNRLKIVVKGNQAEIYLNDSTRPTLVVKELRREAQKGMIGLWALNGNHFANFRYTPMEAVPVASINRPPAKEFLATWSLSKIYDATKVKTESYPDKAMQAGMNWETVSSESSGLVNISRFRKKAISNMGEGNSLDVVYAKVTLEAASDQTRKLNFDFSDRITIFLNGKPIFSGDNTFLSKGSMFRGEVRAENQTLYVDLKRGSNELLIAVTERANGWGYIFKLDSPDGLTMHP